MFHLSILHLILLGCSALIAGCVDTIAGGGGLICVPALMLAGLPPASVLGTNKFQATFGTGSATVKFMQHGNIRWRDVWIGCCSCLIGASLGALLIQRLNPAFLHIAFPILLVVVLLYMLLVPNAGAIERHAYLKPNPFFIGFGLLLGFYDGFFGPGTGTFWAAALVFFLGFDLKRATMHAKIYNFISNLVSLVWFILGGKIVYSVGITMALGQFIGARLGAWLVIHKGTRFIRPLFITMVVCMLISLIYKHFV